MIFIPIEQADHFSRRIRSCWNSSSVRARSGQRKGQNSWSHQRGHCNLRTYSTLTTTSITCSFYSSTLSYLIPSTFHPISFSIILSFQLISRGHYRNFGLRYEYTVPKKEPDRAPEYSWVFSDWSLCTATCGGGTQTSKPFCNEKKSGVVEEHFCESIEKPETKLRECNLNPCPAR